VATPTPSPRGGAPAPDHAEGLLFGDPARLRSAVEQFRATPRKLALATALEDAAGPGRGRAGWLEESLALVTECGARQAQQRLEKRLGPAPGAPPAEPVCLPQLSSAERKVALLVAEGLTNVEVAAKLFLSKHTVDSHLRKIFTKLGLNRRVELARVVARECGGNSSTT
jgi:DNA-binding CsgD family transcriptional regulator